MLADTWSQSATGLEHKAKFAEAVDRCKAFNNNFSEVLNQKKDEHLSFFKSLAQSAAEGFASTAGAAADRSEVSVGEPALEPSPSNSLPSESAASGQDGQACDVIPCSGHRSCGREALLTPLLAAPPSFEPGPGVALSREPLPPAPAQKLHEAVDFGKHALADAAKHGKHALADAAKHVRGAIDGIASCNPTNRCRGEEEESEVRFGGARPVMAAAPAAARRAESPGASFHSMP